MVLRSWFIVGPLFLSQATIFAFFINLLHMYSFGMDCTELMCSIHIEWKYNKSHSSNFLQLHYTQIIFFSKITMLIIPCVVTSYIKVVSFISIFWEVHDRVLLRNSFSKLLKRESVETFKAYFTISLISKEKICQPSASFWIEWVWIVCAFTSLGR